MKTILKILIAIYFLCFFLLIESCEKKYANNTRKLYIITKEDSIRNKNHTESGFPPPILSFYSDNNFIFDNINNTFYLHKKRHEKRFCGTGIDNTKPDFINLNPSDFLKIDEIFINNFIQKNKGKKDLTIAIIRFKDTIKYTNALLLIDFAEKNLKKYNIRMVTEEEDIVLQYLRKERKFNPKRINWSSNFSDKNEIPKIDLP